MQAVLKNTNTLSGPCSRLLFGNGNFSPSSPSHLTDVPCAKHLRSCRVDTSGARNTSVQNMRIQQIVVRSSPHTRSWCLFPPHAILPDPFGSFRPGNTLLSKPRIWSTHPSVDTSSLVKKEQNSICQLLSLVPPLETFRETLHPFPSLAPRYMASSLEFP